MLSVKTRSSADADNRLDAFSGQSRSTNIYMVPFHMLHIVSYCAIVTRAVPNTRFVFEPARIVHRIDYSNSAEYWLHTESESE